MPAEIQHPFCSERTEAPKGAITFAKHMVRVPALDQTFGTRGHGDGDERGKSMGIKERNGAREGHTRVDRAGCDPDSWASPSEYGGKELRAGGLQGAPHSLCLHPQSSSVRQGLKEACLFPVSRQVASHLCASVSSSEKEGAK